MEDVLCILLFLLAGLVVLKRSRAVDRRILAARKRRERIWETIQAISDGERRRRRRRNRMIQLLLQNCRRRPTVWAFNRSSEWWDAIVPGFTDTQWIQNFRMSKDTFHSLCDALRPAMEKQDTNFRVCVPLEKRVAIAVRKFVTTAHYGIVADLFGVSKTTVCRCVLDFNDAARELLVPEQFRDRETRQQLSAFCQSRSAPPQCVGAVEADRPGQPTAEAEPVVAAARGADEEGGDVREGGMPHSYSQE